MRFTTRDAFLKRNRRYLDAVSDVSFEIRAGEVFGLVGESGSGKSTIARLITGIHTPSAGRVIFAGTDLTALRRRADAAPWRRQMQMIFQDPFSSLNGRMRVREIIGLIDITPLPRTPEFVKGVINLRGKIIPVIANRRGGGWKS